MTRPEPPAEVAAAAEARADARRRREWTEADRLRSVIEEAGWSVVDDGERYRLRPAHPADLEIGGLVRYGWSGAVPRREAAEVGAGVTIVVVFTGVPASEMSVVEPARALASSLAMTDETGVLLVIDGLGRADVPGLDPGADRLEVVATAATVGPAGSLDIAVRRAAGERLVVLDGPGPHDPVTIARLVAALDDPDVAIAGHDGLSLAHLPRLEPAPPQTPDAVSLRTAAFRRRDAVALGQPDLRLRTWAGAGAWLSMALVSASEPGHARRVVVIAAGGDVGGLQGDVDAALGDAVRRDGYRILRNRA